LAYAAARHALCRTTLQLRTCSGSRAGWASG
jgi:hypothetical protein